MRVFGIALSLIMVMAFTAFAGYMVHEKILSSELRFYKLETYITCVKANEKDQCEFILKR